MSTGGDVVAIRDDPPAAVVGERLRELVGELRRYEPLAREDAPDAVHQMRVQVRRLRSALATYRPLLDRDLTDPVRAELKWLGVSLGQARDLEVVREQVVEGLSDLGPRDGIDRVVEFVDRQLGAAHARAHRRFVETMSSTRYVDLLDRLEQLAAAPPWRADAPLADPGVLRRRVRHDWRRLDHRVTALGELSAAQQDAGLHEVRKAAKRARYAAEPLVRSDGAPAKRFVKAMKMLQSSLGRHQDEILVGGYLGDLADRATTAGMSAVALTALQDSVAREAARERARFPREWERASRKRLRRWTKIQQA